MPRSSCHDCCYDTIEWCIHTCNLRENAENLLKFDIWLVWRMVCFISFDSLDHTHRHVLRDYCAQPLIRFLLLLTIE